MKATTPSRPVLYEATRSLNRLIATTGCTASGTGASIAADSGTKHLANAASVKLTSGSNQIANFTWDAGGVIVMTRANAYLISIYCDTSGQVTFNASHASALTSGHFTDGHRKNCNILAADVNKWITFVIPFSDCAVDGAGPTLASMRYFMLTTNNGGAGIVRNSWWNDLGWLGAQDTSYTMIDGNGVQMLDLSAVAPYGSTNGTHIGAVVSGGQNYDQWQSTSGGVMDLMYDLGDGIDCSSGEWGIDVWRDPAQLTLSNTIDPLVQFTFSPVSDFSTAPSGVTTQNLCNPGVNHLRFHWSQMTTGPTEPFRARFLRVRIPAVTATVNSIAVGRLRKHVACQPIVVLAFDDCYTSWLTIVAPILKTAGFNAVGYCPGALIGVQLSWADLGTLHNTYGWDICNHFWTHSSHASDDYATALADLTLIQNAMRANGFTRGGEDLHGSYPLGGYGNPCWQACQALGIRSMRTVHDGVLAHETVRDGTPLSFDAYRVQNAGDGTEDTVAALLTKAQDASKFQAIKMFTFHDMAATGAGLAFTTANFQLFINELKRRHTAGMIRVMSLTDAWAQCVA